MMLCRTVVINSLYLEIFTLAIYSKFQLVAAVRQQFAGGGVPMQ
jgi:hypothetical protein